MNKIENIYQEIFYTPWKITWNETRFCIKTKSLKWLQVNLITYFHCLRYWLIDLHLKKEISSEFRPYVIMETL